MQLRLHDVVLGTLHNSARRVGPCKIAFERPGSGYVLYAAEECVPRSQLAVVNDLRIVAGVTVRQRFFWPDAPVLKVAERQSMDCARRRRALVMTLTLDRAMAAAAMMGESRSPKTG